MCVNKKKEIYGCNSAPSEPPKSTDPSYSEYSFKSDLQEYLDYFDITNEDHRLKHELYCTASDDVTCYSDNSMHNGLKYCFEDSVDSKFKSSVEKCQNSAKSKLFDGNTPNHMKDNGKTKNINDITKHIPQQGTTTHVLGKEQYIQANPLPINQICNWQIKADFYYRYLRWQDIQLRFDEIKNMDIYITSYFR